MVLGKPSSPVAYTLRPSTLVASSRLGCRMRLLASPPLQDKRLTREEWGAFKAQTPFGQMPVLEVDGKMLAQSSAIGACARLSVFSTSLCHPCLPATHACLAVSRFTWPSIRGGCLMHTDPLPPPARPPPFIPQTATLLGSQGSCQLTHGPLH